MSYGDELMAAGHAETEARRIGGKVAILGKTGNVRWSDLWRGNPFIASPEQERNGEARGTVRNGPHCRPYIKYPFTTESGATFTDWRARDHKGTIYFEAEEDAAIKEYRRLLGDYIIVEPNIAAKANPNKKWAWDKWQTVVNLLLGYTILQLGPTGTKTLHGITRIETMNFRHACLVLASARVLVTTEGGLHHAAAAMRKSAVVIFGGHTSPQTTGYPEHVNLYRVSDSPCGKWKPCSHCKESMDMIPAMDVARLVKKEYEKTLS